MVHSTLFCCVISAHKVFDKDFFDEKKKHKLSHSVPLAENYAQ